MRRKTVVKLRRPAAAAAALLLLVVVTNFAAARKATLEVHDVPVSVEEEGRGDNRNKEEGTVAVPPRDSDGFTIGARGGRRTRGNPQRGNTELENAGLKRDSVVVDEEQSFSSFEQEEYTKRGNAAVTTPSSSTTEKKDGRTSSSSSRKRNNKSTLTELEGRFVSQPTSNSSKTHLRYLTSIPHVDGTKGDYTLARYVRDQFESYGIPSVHIDPVETLLNYPLERPVARLLSSSSSGDDDKKNEVLYEASLSEDVEPSDRTSDTMWRNHTFLGYSPSADLPPTQYVYANYGRPQDFDVLLHQHNISVANKIVIVRYGQCFRGLKVMNAQNRGAIGVIIYSDPNDDGYDVGRPYPDGPWRSETSVQRGSVQFLSLCPGDPTRIDPRYDDHRDDDGNHNRTTTKRICGYEAEELIPQIPAIPMSYKDVTPFLKALNGYGPIPSPDFVGGLTREGVTYNVGPSPPNRMIHLKTNHTFDKRKVWNVIGKIPGSLPRECDQPVLLGNHRDAWVYGAADPNSGTSSLLEVAKGLGSLLDGWKPKRTIYLLSWSGEEYGLIGSTAWAELNEHLMKRAVAYLNVDTVVSGDVLEVSASPVLATLWKDVMDALIEPAQPSLGHGDDIGEKGGGMEEGGFQHPSPSSSSVLSSSGIQVPYNIIDANINRGMLSVPTDSSNDGDDDDIGTLGSGSDYTAFLDHYGIPSLDFSYKKRSMYGVYHSVYDSFDWMVRYGGLDGVPGSAFDLMADAAKIWGVLALRLSESDVLPLDHVTASRNVERYIGQLRRSYNVSDLEPTLDGLVEAVELYKTASLQVRGEIEERVRGGVPGDGGSGGGDSSIDAAAGRGDSGNDGELNERLAYTERKFLSPDGLPKRPYFRHVLQAPGLYLGYASEVFPGVSQACDDGDYVTANEQLVVAAECVRDAAAFLSPDAVA